MGRSRYKILDERYPYFLTSSVIHRYPIFKEESICRILIEVLNFLVDERDVEIYGFLIMPDHLHLIAKGQDLGKYFSGFKSYAARRIIDRFEDEKRTTYLNLLKEGKLPTKIDREYQLWTEGYHPKQIFSEEVMRQKLEYIHYNPVKAGLVSNSGQWLYSSYNRYLGKEGLVNIKIFSR